MVLIKHQSNKFPLVSLTHSFGLWCGRWGKPVFGRGGICRLVGWWHGAGFTFRHVFVLWSKWRPICGVKTSVFHVGLLVISFLWILTDPRRKEDRIYDAYSAQVLCLIKFRQFVKSTGWACWETQSSSPLARSSPWPSGTESERPFWYGIELGFLSWLHNGLTNIMAASWCKKFQANIFNKSKCQNCFRSKEQHSAEALESAKVRFNFTSLSVCVYGWWCHQAWLFGWLSGGSSSAGPSRRLAISVLFFLPTSHINLLLVWHKTFCNGVKFYISQDGGVAYVHSVTDTLTMLTLYSLMWVKSESPPPPPPPGGVAASGAMW